MKQYEVSDEDLVRWVGTWSTEDEVNRAGYHFGSEQGPDWKPSLGEVVVTSAHGKFRRGVVISVGRLRAKIQLTTPSAAEEARKGYQVYSADSGWVTSHELHRTTLNVRFALIAGAAGYPEMVDGSFGSDVGNVAATVEQLVQVPVNEGGFVDQPDLSDEQRTRLDTERLDPEQDEVCGCTRNPLGHTCAEHPTNLPGFLNELVGQDQADLLGDETCEECETTGINCPLHRDNAAAQEALDQVLSDEARADGSDAVDWQDAPPVLATGSAVVTALERMCDAVRANHPELPEVVVVTGSGFTGSPRWGHTRHGGWTDRRNQVTQDGVTTDARLVEVFVAGECLARGAAFTLETILHELAHVLAGARGVQDTSRQGRWHNQQFRKLAEELGLEYPKDQAHPQVGFSECVLTPGTTEEYADQIQELDRVVRLAIELPGFLSELVGQDGEPQPVGGEFVHHGRRRKSTGGGGPDTNNLRATCQCGPTPRIIRASRKVLAEDPIICGRCREAFVAPDMEVEPSDEDQ